MTNKVITSVTADNSSKYSALFKAATDYLIAHVDEFPEGPEYEYRASIIHDMVTIDEETGQEHIQYISSVQEYFSHLKDLLDLGGKTFLMLPLDEPYLEINANSRDIVIPAEFKKNGFGVKGDNTAENLIFKMPRFFDAMDLLNAEIRVQWKNAKGDEGISNIDIIDAKKSADYLYFMWPLTTAITDEKGIFTFSVRFYILELNDNVVYSYSTKIAQGMISEGHNFDVAGWQGTIDRADDDFRANIKNSKNIGAESAAEPFFIINLSDHFQENENYEQIVTDATDGQVLQCYLDDEHPERILRVEAGVNDTGYFHYDFKYRDLTLPAQAVTNALQVKYAYFPVTEVAPIQGKRYYVKDGVDSQGRDVFVPSVGEFNPDTAYEQTAYVVVSKELNPNNHVVGKYNAIISNNKNGSSAEIQSPVIIFPGPEILDYAENGNLSPYKFLTGTDDTISVDVVADEFGTKVAYDWYKIADPSLPYDLDELDLGELANNFTFVTTTYDGKLDVTGEPGIYTVVITSTRNYEHKTIPGTNEADESKNRKACKVCNLPPSVTNITPASNKIETSAYHDIILKVEFDRITDPLLTEGLTYQWYRLLGERDGVQVRELIEGESGPCQVSAADPTKMEATMLVHQYDTGAFDCDIINTIGNQSTITNSFDFSVSPTTENNNNNTPAEPEPEEPVVEPDNGDDNPPDNNDGE